MNYTGRTMNYTVLSITEPMVHVKTKTRRLLFLPFSLFLLFLLFLCDDHRPDDAQFI